MDESKKEMPTEEMTETPREVTLSAPAAPLPDEGQTTDAEKTEEVKEAAEPFRGRAGLLDISHVHHQHPV